MKPDKADKTFYFTPIRIDGEPGGVDVVTYYADFGFPYKEGIKAQSRSVKSVMPDARRVLLTPNAIDLVTSFDKLVMLDFDPERKTLMADRTMTHIRWARGTNRRAIYCDCDLEFQKAPVFDGSFDIGILWRKKRPDMPVNSSMILAEPGFPKFWEKLAAIVVNIPAPMKEWWCDQISLSLLLGVCHEKGDIVQIEDARVKLFDARYCSDTPDSASEETWAIHRKGHHKGDWFRALYSEIDPKDGKLLGALCSSTDTLVEPKSESQPDSSPPTSAT